MSRVEQVDRGRCHALAIELAPTVNGLPENAHSDIRRVLERHGFTRQQGSVYFGDNRVNAVTCVLAAMDLSRSLPWFAASVRDIQMLRIEELNELMPAVRVATA